jgi:hypothetical protein
LSIFLFILDTHFIVISSMDHSEIEPEEPAQSYRDQLRQLLKSTPRERSSVWSLPGSSTGSVHTDHSQDDDQLGGEEDASMNDYNDAEEPQDKDVAAPEPPDEIDMVMTCVAE